MGRTIEVAGVRGILWAIQHVAAFGDIPTPWTRLTLRRNGGSEATRGLAPDTRALISDTSTPEHVSEPEHIAAEQDTAAEASQADQEETYEADGGDTMHDGTHY
jgi:hypothetical protein